MTPEMENTGERRAVLAFLAATTSMLVVHLLPTPEPLERAGEVIALTPDGKTCLAILLFAVTLWVTEAMPFPATSLLVLVLIPAFGITDFSSAVNAGFGNPLIVFFIGVLFLSTASPGPGSALGWCSTCCDSPEPAPTEYCSGSSPPAPCCRCGSPTWLLRRSCCHSALGC